MALISVSTTEGVKELPTPSAYDVIPNEITKSSRNTLGNLYKYRIAIKRSITVSWNILTPEQKNLVLSATQPNKFRVTYFDSSTSTYLSGSFYRGNDLTITPVPPFKDGEFRYYSVSMSLTEF